MNDGATTVDLEIFDPDTYNGNGSADAVEGESVDEIRYSQGSNPQKSNVDDTADYDKAHTTTRYRLYDTKGTPQLGDDELIAETSYQDDPDSDMQWVTPDGFSIDIADERWASRFSASGDNPVNFRLNIKTINGASENGFNLRAGPSRETIEYTVNEVEGYWEWKETWKWNRRKGRWEREWERDWVSGYTEYYYEGEWHDDPPEQPSFDPYNGTNITATGRIPMNFNAYGIATITLGHVPAGATSVSIAKFDTDVGAQYVTYSDGNNTYSGVLSGGDEWKTDEYDLGDNYQGGDWTATYSAGTGDTSVWDMSFVGPTSLTLVAFDWCSRFVSSEQKTYKSTFTI